VNVRFCRFMPVARPLLFVLMNHVERGIRDGNI
jgi:hypothetical protein